MLRGFRGAHGHSPAFCLESFFTTQLIYKCFGDLMKERKEIPAVKQGRS